MILSAILFFWGVFVSFWIGSAVGNKQNVEEVGARNRLRFGVPLAVAAILLFHPVIKGVSHVPFIDMPIFFHGSGFVFLGSLVTLSGLLLAIWARMTIGVDWSSSVTVKEDHELITGGPYAYVLHPIYTAVVLMFLGTSFAVGTVGGYLAVVLALGSFLYKFPLEEAFMLRLFPADYPAYRARTARLFPGIY
ncbi:MAG: isoprenylcysteine carboxylmethyltransferase family protein [Patescibacteria group bacterium]